MLEGNVIAAQSEIRVAICVALHFKAILDFIVSFNIVGYKSWNLVCV